MKYSVFSTAVHPLTGRREVRRNVHKWLPARRWEGKLWPGRWERVDSRWFADVRRSGFTSTPREAVN